MAMETVGEATSHPCGCGGNGCNLRWIKVCECAASLKPCNTKGAGFYMICSECEESYRPHATDDQLSVDLPF